MTAISTKPVCQWLYRPNGFVAHASPRFARDAGLAVTHPCTHARLLARVLRTCMLFRNPGSVA
ncbi:hypothetical protein LAM19_22675, partial [Mycobacterium tuberculosis]|nr:hypothetical protein [Mycobacterium tuberculosis]